MSTETTLAPPAVGTYTIDPTHSSVTFVARHLGGAKVRGNFADFSGAITIADSPEVSSVEAEVQAASITTGNEQRDGHLKSPDFFDLENFPTLTLKSTKITIKSDSEFTLTGDLTIRGITKSVDFNVEYLGSGPHMIPDTTAIAFEATAEVDRRDFNVSFNGALENGSLVVGNKVKIEIEIEASKAN